ncbi:MAG: hydroxymethylglutaryl-CoA reductase [Candidatus Rokuibacteriota bacterium]
MTSTVVGQAPPLPKDDVRFDGRHERLRILEAQGIRLDVVTGRTPVVDATSFQERIENFVGLACIPIGIVGPIRVDGAEAHGDFYIPMATTEGTLVASYNRGAKVIGASGGARVLGTLERVSRTPAFVFRTVHAAATFARWVEAHEDVFRRVAATTTRHGRLDAVQATVVGNQVHLDCAFTTADAAGQNMVTFATEAICREILASTPLRPRSWFLEGNFSGDKKATARSLLGARGRRVSAEVVAPRDVVLRECHVSPELMLECSRVATVGAMQSGAIGAQGHYANALAAIFIACGQDVACVAEAAVGITHVELDDRGDLYVSVTLPNLIVGTVGGGTDLPTQRECLQMLGCAGDGGAPKLAEICAATVLAGEISLIAALASGQFAAAHARYGRRGSLGRKS